MRRPPWHDPDWWACLFWLLFAGGIFFLTISGGGR